MSKNKNYNKFNLYNSIGKEEIGAGLRVLRSGKLSGFMASYQMDLMVENIIIYLKKNYLNFIKLGMQLS